MITILYILVFSFIAYLYPMKTWYVLVLISVGGAIGMLQEILGLKPWVLWTIEFLYGIIGFRLLIRERNSDIFKFRFASLLFITGAWLFLYGIVVAFSLPVFWLSFQGGFIAIFMLAYLDHKSLWKGLVGIVGIHLFLSACVYYLTPDLPWFGVLDGMQYNQKTAEVLTYSGEFSRGLIKGGSGIRGAGVYYNQNAWSQVSGWGTIVGCSIILAQSKIRSKFYGFILMVLGVLGLLGSMSRSAILAAIVSVLLLVVVSYIKHIPIRRFLAGITVGLIVFFLIRQIFELSNTVGVEFFSDKGFDYRIKNFSLVWEQFGNFWIGGRQGQGNSLDPHDILSSSLYNFGLLGLLLTVFCLLGGLILTWRWILVGEMAIGPYLGVPVEYEAIASIALAPLFIFYVIAGVGNGLAGGLPYNNVFFLFGYFGWNTIRSKKLIWHSYQQNIYYR